MKISAKKYASALYELTQGKKDSEIDAIVLGFARELKKQRKINITKEIIDNFSNIYNKENGIVMCEIISARKIGNDQIEKIKDFIKDKYDAKKIIAELIIDESVKGGFILRIGDEVIDGSISKKLKNLNILLRR